MASRIELDKILNSLGARKVYFQPPESIKIEYPAIIYSRKTINNTYANDDVYMQNVEYSVNVIDTNPDSEIVKKLSRIKHCRHTNHYVSSNLNYDSFVIKI